MSIKSTTDMLEAFYLDEASEGYPSVSIRLTVVISKGILEEEGAGFGLCQEPPGRIGTLIVPCT